jgi:hypothetical protein
MKHLLPTILIALVAASQLGATDCGQALRDPGFDLWCGDQLCAWKVERGSVLRVPTWNEGDPGVELAGSDVAIEQLSPVSSGDGSCLELDLIANIDPDADVELRVDVSGDGTIEETERLPTARWQQLSYAIAIKPPYSGLRFELAKTGGGKAILADIGAKLTDACGGLTPIASPAPLGEPCNAGTDCASGLCDSGLAAPPFDTGLGQCTACDATHPCDAGQVCGLGDPVSPVRAVPTMCVAANARQLGEACATDAECATGICTEGVCSTCRDTGASGCAGAESCGPAWASTSGLPIHSPFVCAPNDHARAHGEPCASNADCASGACVGSTRSQCDDGRSCATAADCPFGTPDVPDGLQNGPCSTVGVQGGSCQ